MSTAPPRSAALRRYAPFVVIVVVLTVVGIAFAVTRTDDLDDSSGDVAEAALTFDEAVDEGVETSDWKNCDQESGRVAIPYPYRPPCVQPRADDDEITSDVQGVTDDEISIVVYINDPGASPGLFAVFGELGFDTDPADTEDTIGAYMELFEEQYETYGRRLNVEFYRGTGSADDETAARNDAIRIATDHRPFAVIGGPLQAPEFGQELAARGVVCVQNCVLATPREVAIDNLPYMYPVGPVPEQAQTHAGNFVGKQLVGKDAEFAGDEAFHDNERVFGYVSYDTADGYYTPSIEQLVSTLRDDYDTGLAVHRRYLLDPTDLARNQAEAEAFVAALKDAGVSTVLFSGDPIMPRFLTESATAQDYFPEWVITSTVLADTTALARAFEPDQWAHAFGISLPSARGEQAVQPSYALYEWQYCAPPVSNAYATHITGPLHLLTGIHMAGPDLRPETFEAGWFKYPPTGGEPAAALVSRGEHDIWPDFDPGGSDDATVIYWDPDAVGPDEAGQIGDGMYRYVNGGERYRPLDWPDQPLPLFDDERSVTLLTDFGDADLLPAYDSPCGGPAVSAPSGRGGDR